MFINATLDEGARLPERGTKYSAGLDLFVKSREWDPVDKVFVYDTGVHVEIPEGYVGFLLSRSSVAHVFLVLTNGAGTIDSDYRGPIKAKYAKREDETRIFEVGEKFCQLVIVPCLLVDLNIVDKLSETERGAGGYGSTGK